MGYKAYNIQLYFLLAMDALLIFIFYFQIKNKFFLRTFLLLICFYKIKFMRLSVCLLLMFLSTHIYAQLAVGSNEYPTIAAGKFKPADIAKFRSSTTFFRLPDKLNPEDERTFTEVLVKNWKLTKKLVVITKNNENDIDKVSGPVSVIRTKVTLVGRTNSLMVDDSYVCLSVEMLGEQRKGFFAKDNTKYFGMIMLYPKVACLKQQGRGMFYSNLNQYEKVANDPACVNNWSAGFLLNCFDNMSKKLDNNETLWLYGNVVNKAAKEDINKKGLHIPDYVLQKYSIRKIEPNYKKEELFKGFKLKYVVEPMSKINLDILTNYGREDYYYLIPVVSVKTVYYMVINAKNSEIVYKFKVNNTYKIKNKHLRKISSFN